ncbi:MAG: beta-lactamase [Gemmatimonadetes bacterium]|nr:beta-lactamase [Gemmatimonadota bacterium]
MQRRGLRTLHGYLALTAFMAVGAPALAQQASAAPVPLAGLDAYIQDAVKTWGIAGLAIAIVKDNSVVYAKGFGVREAGKPAPVDAHTLFAIGSNSKFFTSTVAGMMVDAGRMKWDDPATKFLPGFQMYDPYVTREMTIRDLLSHRSGLGRRGDMLWYASPFDRAEIIRRIRFLKPNSSFRSQYGYQNVMVMTAGEAAAAAGGTSWDSLVTQRIFRPLGMTLSSTTVRALAGQTNLASPHLSDGAAATPIPWRNIDNIGPAGSINSNVLDMAQWLRFLLANGRVGTTQLIKPATLREIESPQTIVPSADDSLSPSTHFHAYGLGIGMYDYLGVKVLSHTGGIDGMLSQVTLIPERRLGIVILTNTEGHNNTFAAIARRVVDAYLGAPARDWSGIMLAQTRAQEAAQAAAAKLVDAARPKDTRSSVSPEHFVGQYTNEMYGDVHVAAEGGHQVLHFGSGFTGDLEHWANDSYKITWRDRREGTGLVTFVVNPVGQVSSLKLWQSLTPAALRNEDVDEFKRVGASQSSP